MSKSILASVLLACLPMFAQGTYAYIYYSDAYCKTPRRISGTFNLAYDDSSLKGYGKTKEDYEGSCIYFTGGRLNLQDYQSATDYMNHGYCVTCNGVAMCSLDSSCDNAVSVSSTSNLYQMSQANENSYQKTEVSAQPFKYTQEVNAAVMSMISEQSRSLSAAWYALIGGCIGLVSLFGLLAALEGHRQYRMRRAHNAGLEEAFDVEI